MRNTRKLLQRGDIVWADLGEHPGSHVQSGRRPCIIINTNKGNGCVYTVIPGSCKQNQKGFPVHVIVSPKEVSCGLNKKTVFMAEQITTIDERQIIVKVGHIPYDSKILVKLKDIIIRQLQLGV